MWQKGWREQIWANLSEPWDLLIIGGGITGAGILREASRAGLRALLVEAHDFASGTSSRNSIPTWHCGTRRKKTRRFSMRGWRRRFDS